MFYFLIHTQSFIKPHYNNRYSRALLLFIEMVYDFICELSTITINNETEEEELQNTPIGVLIVVD